MAPGVWLRRSKKELLYSIGPRGLESTLFAIGIISGHLVEVVACKVKTFTVPKT
jgi:hypothetical protein